MFWKEMTDLANIFRFGKNKQNIMHYKLTKILEI